MNGRFLQALILSISSVFPGVIALCAGTVYVAPTGDDSHPGTALQPVKTLNRALDVARATPGSKNRVIEVGPGAYFLKSQLQLEKRDSGLVITGRQGGSRPVISGGRLVTGWRKAEGSLWKAPHPADAREPQIMRAGDEAQILARTPNFDPANPIQGGWMFAGKPAGEGAFDAGLGGLHTVGDWIEWQIDVPATGKYALWMRYAADNAQFLDGAGMRGRMQMQVDGGPPHVLETVPDTGGWDVRRWNCTGTLDLAAGRRVLRWTNLKGGGLNLDALALADDEAWSPDGSGMAIAPGKNLIVIQAETYARAQVKEISSSKLTYPVYKDHFTFRPNDLSDYPLSPAPRLHLFPAWGWVNTILELERVDPAGNQAWVKRTRSASEEIWPGNRYYVANIREGLDSPGEWWPDPKMREILWWPEKEDDVSKEVVVPALDRLITIASAENITIRGLEFRDTTYSLEIGVYAPDDAAIHLKNAKHCVIEGNRFYRLGGYAVSMEEGASNNKFAGNEVAWPGQGGVILKSWQPGSAPENNLVAGNYFHHLGQIYKHVAAVYCTTAHGTRVAHNLIEDVPRYGISFKGYGPGLGSHGNIAEYNEIIRSNLETNDTGAIETLGRDKEDSGNIIRFNRIIDVVGIKTTEDGEIVSPFMTWGIYLDDYSSGTTIYGNLVARTVSGAVAIHGGRNNWVEGNIFVDAQEQQLWYHPIDEFSTGNTVVRNIMAFRSPKAALIYQVDAVPGQTPQSINREIDYNLYWRFGGAADELLQSRHATPLGGFAQWQAGGFDRHSRVEDPLFTDPAKDDYHLREDSPARALGIQDLPWEKIGLRGYGRGWKR